jgi:hypothetical protein
MNIIRTGISISSFLAGIIAIDNAKKRNIASAIGTLSELTYQSLVLQDVSFNVLNAEHELKSLSALTQNTFKLLRKSTKNGKIIFVGGFGPNAYSSPLSFHPGISTYYSDGGHATVTFQSPVKQATKQFSEIYQSRDNGLKFLKIGTDALRLSKGIESGGFNLI